MVLITNGETSMSGIAASVILGLVEVGAQLISGYQQNKALVEGQEEARALNENQLAESRAARRSSEALQRSQLSLSRKSLEESTRLKERELNMLQDQQAREAFRDQVSNLTQVMDKNENLKDLFLTRLKGLRN